MKTTEIILNKGVRTYKKVYKFSLKKIIKKLKKSCLSRRKVNILKFILWIYQND